MKKPLLWTTIAGTFVPSVLNVLICVGVDVPDSCFKWAFHATVAVIGIVGVIVGGDDPPEPPESNEPLLRWGRPKQPEYQI